MIQPARSVGSGVVMSEDGWIVTNAHVVLGAERIDVTVARMPKTRDGPWVREQLPAKLAGADVDSDLAVLKVDAKGLKALPLADSDALRPGQLVLAFGSPLRLEGSVSMGVVSAVDRQAEPDSPMVFIQTDAPINPGSSGGPLVDARGRVVGINTFILSTTGGNQGLGFAIPSDIVKSVFEQVRNEGRVSHGSIGVRAQAVSPMLATDLALPQTWGALVADVLPGSPADDAGLEVGDIVVSLDGNRIDSGRELNARVHATRPGRTVMLGVVRRSKRLDAEVVVSGLPGVPSELLGAVNVANHLVSRLGALCISLRDVGRENASQFRSRTGVVVLDVDESRIGTEPTLPGDVIVAVGRVEVETLDELRRALASTRSGSLVTLRVERQGIYRYVSVEVE